MIRLTHARDSVPAPRTIRWRLGAVLAAMLILAAAFWSVAGGWVKSHAAASAGEAAGAAARTQAGLLESELQKFRLLPVVLTEYPDARMVLASPGAGLSDRLNAKLAALAERTGASVIYLLDPTGLTVAASNASRPDSFVGQNYGFRPYFQEAMHDGSAEFFALGTVSRRPGLFLAQRIESGGETIGVVVVKVEFDHIERAWTRQTGHTFVTDRHGIVLVASQPQWRFHTTRPIASVQAKRFRDTLQFGDVPLQPLPVRMDGRTFAERDTGGKPELFMPGTAKAAVPGWTLYYLEPAAPALTAARAQANVAFLALAGLTLLAFAVWFRLREKAQIRAAARAELEAEVERRTAELRAANDRLLVESAERERSEKQFRAAREELAQANRLGSIGQITAGVAHEINQPVAAIRTFAENAMLLLGRGDQDAARGNLGMISGLTERIGNITAELRAFARRGSRPSGPVPLHSAIDGALLLIGDRLRTEGIALERSGNGDRDLLVHAERIQLEQVLINLLQNALDALDNHPEPRIRLTVKTGATAVTIYIADNGPGIAPEVADDIFTPFVSGKPQGLGLGLGIARDIVREFGGELSIDASPLGGAAFAIRLNRS